MVALQIGREEPKVVGVDRMFDREQLECWHGRHKGIDSGCRRGGWRRSHSERSRTNLPMVRTFRGASSPGNSSDRAVNEVIEPTGMSNRTKRGTGAHTQRGETLGGLAEVKAGWTE